MLDNDLRRTRIGCELRNHKLRAACMCLLTFVYVCNSTYKYVIYVFGLSYLGRRLNIAPNSEYREIRYSNSYYRTY